MIGWRVEDRGYKTPCWIWEGAKTKRGYGIIRRKPHRTMYAHRWFWIDKYGAIPVGWEPDHLCRVHDCIRLDHLELVTHHENTLRGEVGKYNKRKTHCPQDHPYTPENTYIKTNGGRICRTCYRAYDRERQRKRRQLRRLAIARLKPSKTK